MIVSSLRFSIVQGGYCESLPIFEPFCADEMQKTMWQIPGWHEFLQRRAAAVYPRLPQQD